MKNKIITSILLIASICIVLTGCSKRLDVEPIDLNENIPKPNKELIDPEYIGTYNTNEYSVQNAVELIDLLSTDKNDNVIISETSLNMALSMLLEGADPTSVSYSELMSYLDNSVYENNIDEIRNRNKWLMNAYSNTNQVTLKLANSIWAHNAYTINNDFKDDIKNFYNGTVNVVDFTNSNASMQINQWCSDNTEGCIDEIVGPSLLTENDCILVNALYFNGLWKNPFEEKDCKDDEFNNADGSKSIVTMMHDYDAGAYYSNDNAEAFMKYYEGNELAFVGILPKNKEFTLADLDIDSLLENYNYDYKVHAIMPSFIVEDTNSLIPALSNNLTSAMSDIYTEILSGESTEITSIIQKTYVDVNPKGTEASAVTAIGFATTSIPDNPPKEVTINLNRPFVFMIYDTNNHEVLFIGKINTL